MPKKWKHLDIAITAQRFSDTHTLRRARNAMMELFGWKLKPLTAKQIKVIDDKLTKQYKLLSVVDDIYGYRSSVSKKDFVDGLFTLIHGSK
jgi:hypothetical protein